MFEGQPCSINSGRNSGIQIKKNCVKCILTSLIMMRCFVFVVVFVVVVIVVLKVVVNIIVGLFTFQILLTKTNMNS